MGVAPFATWFRAGTRLMTLRGEVPVERIGPADRLLTLSGVGVPMKRPACLGRRAADRRMLLVRRDATAPGQPQCDMWLIETQSIALIDSAGQRALVPGSRLANGATITRDELAPDQSCFGFDLAAHDIVMAEGLPVEIGQAGPDHPSCAAVLAASDAARHDAALRDRATALGYRTSEDADLQVMADDVPVIAVPGTHSYVLPPDTRVVSLRSRSFIPIEADRACGDDRRLGIPLAGLLLDDQSLSLDSPSLVAGFQPPEENGAWRWTDGAATLCPIPSPNPVKLTLLLQQGWGRYWQLPG
jgi:hypothetical protein